jgi:hypothetical protein
VFLVVNFALDINVRHVVITRPGYVNNSQSVGTFDVVRGSFRYIGTVYFLLNRIKYLTLYIERRENSTILACRILC